MDFKKGCFFRKCNKLSAPAVLIAQALQAVSNFIRTLEKNRSFRHAVPIYGHSLAQGLAEITYREFRTLFEVGIFTIGKLLQTDKLTGQYTKVLSHRIVNNQLFQRATIFKLNLLLGKICHSNLNKIVVTLAPVFERLIQGRNMSQVHKKIKEKELTQSISKAPAYNTQIRDRIMVPDTSTFISAYCEYSTIQ